MLQEHPKINKEKTTTKKKRKIKGKKDYIRTCVICLVREEIVQYVLRRVFGR